MAIVGAGGIGFDVAAYLTDPSHPIEGKPPKQPASLSVDEFLKEWGIDRSNSVRGGIEGMKPNHDASGREVYLLQRKAAKLGGGLGKTTGWIHRAELKNRGVHMIPGVKYDRVDDDGLWITTKEV